MKKKIAVITGGYKGNGKAIVDKFLLNNFKVYSIDIGYKKNYFSEKLIKLKINLEKTTEIEKVIKLIKKRENSINVLVNNAGISLKTNSKNFFKNWQKTLAVNLTAPYIISLLCLPMLKKNNKSSIVNITSLNGKVAMSNNPSYNASKGGISALTMSQALDFSKFNIRVNAVSPGYIKTDMTKKSYNNSNEYKKRINRIMLNEYGLPNDVANAVFFLASESAAYINSSEIIVDGGFLKKGI
jgi:NAD(P)-dependent dehydrogenase (short-subunit alcohol dehydrogenase family)